MTRENEVDRWAMLARWAVAVALYLGGCIMVPDHSSNVWPCAVLLVAGAVFWLLKFKARREQERRIDAAELRASIIGQ